MPRRRKRLPPNGLSIIETMSAHGARQGDIASALGMAYPAWQRIRDEDERVQMALNAGNSKAHEKVIGKLFERCMEGDVVACIYLSKIKFGYREGQDVNHQHHVQVTFQMPAALTSDHYEKLINPTPELVTDESD